MNNLSVEFTKKEKQFGEYVCIFAVSCKRTKFQLFSKIPFQKKLK